MRKLAVVSCILLLPAAVACGRSEPRLERQAQETSLERRAEMVSPASSVTLRRYKPPQQAAVATRSLVRTADLAVAVDDTAEAARQIQDLVVGLGGYVGSISSRGGQGLAAYSMTVYVPADDLLTAITSIKQLASAVDREQLRAQDVTERIVDTSARLRTLTATEDELRALLSESRARQQGVEDIMAVYRELTKIRSEIEQLQARLESLENRVALGTLSLELRPSDAVRLGAEEDWDPAATFRDSARTLTDALQSMGAFAIFFAIVLLPITFIVSIPVYGVGRLLRYAKYRQMHPPATVAE